MKKNFSPLLITISLVCLTNLFANGNNEVKVKSTIKEVTVFLKAAQITSVGTTSLEIGTSELVFEGLSTAINSNSIQTKGEGNFTILNVVFRTNYLSQQPKSKGILLIEDSIEIIKMKLELQNNLIAIYDNEEQVLVANRSIGGNNTGVTAIELEKVTTAMRNLLTTVKSKQTEAKIKIKQLNEVLVRLKSQLSEIYNNRNKSTGEIVVSVAAKAPTTAKLTLTYLVNNAGWTPSYDIRATDVNSPVKLNYRANVFQNTGGDWKNINLTLSTGNPTTNGTQPKLSPWWVRFYEPEIKNKKYNAPLISQDVTSGSTVTREQFVNMAQKDVHAISVEENRVSNADNSSNYVQVNNNVVNTEFTISIPYTIPSDGKTHAVEVQSYSMNAQYKYYCVPKLDKDVFLLAKISGWEQYSLLPGESTIFYADTYVGRSFINPISTNDTLDISLGRDKGIAVTREQVKEFSEKKVIGLNKKESITYEITVRNKKKLPVDIDIYDQVPLSSGNEIEVDVLETTQANYEKENGQLSWSVKINPADTKKIRFGYSVKYPKSKIISNL